MQCHSEGLQNSFLFESKVGSDCEQPISNQITYARVEARVKRSHNSFSDVLGFGGPSVWWPLSIFEKYSSAKECCFSLSHSDLEPLLPSIVIFDAEPEAQRAYPP